MRNLLVLAIALRISMSDEDVINLGYDATESEVKTYFNISEDVKVDMEAMTSNHVQSEDFSFNTIKRFMDGKEQTAYKKAFPSEFKKPTTSKKEEKEESKPTEEVKESATNKDAEKEAKIKADAEAKAAKEKAKADADKVKAEEKAKKETEKAEAKAAKVKAKADADKVKAEEKAAKDAEKAESKKKKDEEKAAKDAEKNAPKNLSRSQMMQVYHSEGLEYAQVIQMHPTWNQAHVRNAIYYAKQNPDVVAKTIELRDKLAAIGKPMNENEIALEIPETPVEETKEVAGEVPQATATEESGTTEENVTDVAN